MNPEIMAEWLRRRKYHVVRTLSSHWVSAGARVFQAFPYHWLIRPEEAELRELLWSEKALGLRYSTSVEADEGALSYHVVCETQEYSLDLLPKKARYDVRKGLKHVCIEPISPQRMASEGWELRRETLIRQDRIQSENKSWWEQLSLAIDGLPGFESWGAIERESGILTSSALVFTCDSCTSILYQQSRTNCLHFGVNNALSFTLANAFLKRKGVHQIFYGLSSLDAPPSVDEYKMRMGFQAKPVRQRVAFHPCVSVLFNRASHAGLKMLLKLRPQSTLLSKGEGSVRFYLQGKRPLSEQTLALPTSPPEAAMGTRSSA